MTYLYTDGDLYHFMNVETYEQIPFSAEALGDSLKFLKEMVCKVLSYKGEVLGSNYRSLLSWRLRIVSPA